MFWQNLMIFNMNVFQINEGLVLCMFNLDLNSFALLSCFIDFIVEQFVFYVGISTMFQVNIMCDLIVEWII